MRAAALAHLEDWLTDVRDPDPEQRVWKQAYGDGALLAYERLGLISREEAERWRERFGESEPGVSDEPTLEPDARVRASEYLAGLIESVGPLRRAPNDDAIRNGVECATAIEALHAVGALDDADYEDWRGRLVVAQAPWLEDPTPPPADATFFAIEVPPETEDQAAEDAARVAALAARPTASEVRRVILGSPQRHRGLAVVAVVAHEDAVSVHFHYLGDRQGQTRSGFDSLQAFDETLARLTPPAVTDDAGTVYEPVDQRPSSAGGAGGMPDAERREAITGFWLYTPAPPESARAFEIHRDGSDWSVDRIVR